MPRTANHLAILAVASWLAALGMTAAGQQLAPGEEPLSPEEEATTPETAQRPSLQEELAVLMQALRDPDAADPEKIEQRIVEIWSISGSDTADFLLERGRDAMQAENYTAALDHLTALVDHAPEFAEGWNARATAYFLIEQYGLALADIEHALALNPDHFGALAGLGIILEQMDRPEEALRALRAAQRLNPHRAQVNEAIERLVLVVDGLSL